MKPHEVRSYTVATTGEQVGLTTAESIDSPAATSVTFEVLPRWWAGDDKRPIAIHMNAVNTLGTCPSNYFYHVKVMCVHANGHREELGHFDSTTGKAAFAKRWVWARCTDTIEFVVNLPPSDRKLAWHKLWYVYGPRLKCIFKCGKQGDQHDPVEFGR
jgi:hypothetical protein